MSLFADWQGQVALPPTPLQKERVGGNSILHRPFRGGSFTVQAVAAEAKGHILLRTQLNHPFDELLLRQKNARRVSARYLVLYAPELHQITDLGLDLKLQWDDLSILSDQFSLPDDIRRSWQDKFLFREEDPESGTNGLRPPQIGALHAIAAHFAVGQDFEPATIVLPTGTGKTETMLALLVYRRPNRALVIAPNSALRSQITEKFLSLGVLPDVGVLPTDTIGPTVAKLTTGIRSVAEARELVAKSNVIVALPQTLSASDPQAAAVLTEQCTDLIVDEAHHVPASQWLGVRERFSNKRITQFTATPFRRDRKRVDGRIIFNFKLGDAQSADYYRSITLRTIEEFGDQSERDRSIAEEAIKQLRHDRQTLGLDHILMARCKSKERAENLVDLYQELAPEMSPQLVISGSGRVRHNRDALAKLANRSAGGAHVVICVEMLGEGFDLPNLKVAALHDTHKSLAITLQFIGRFARRGNWEEIGEATVVANIADPDTEKDIESLYAEGADWDRLIRRLSEERISEEIRLQDIVDSLREGGNLHDHLSLWNLRPSLSAQIFKTQCTMWSPERYHEVLPSEAECWHAISEDDAVLVAVIYRSMPVRWGQYEDLFDAQYDLIVARWDRDHGALFLYASDYNGLRSTKLAKVITDDTTTLLQGPVIFNILNNVEMPLVKNLGSSRIGAISFTSYFGPNVTDGLARIEKAEAELNNIACVGYEDGDRVLWGGTQKRGKVWQHASSNISEWIDWTKHTWTKVASDQELETNITRDFLRPIKLDGPYKERPIAVQWGEQAQAGFSDKQFVIFGDTEVPLYLVELEIVSVEGNGNLVFRVSSDVAASNYRFEINRTLDGGYRYERVSGPALYFQRGKAGLEEFAEYLVRDPVIVRYADGTYSYNCYHIPVPLDSGQYSRDQLEVWDWGDIPLNRESMGKDRSKDTIQYHSYMCIAEEYDVIVNDDGKGEAADLVCLKEIDNTTIQLGLVHCKGAEGGRISRDIRNFYTLCGQAQKCISVKHAGIPRLYYHLKRRQDLWLREGCSRLLKGDMKKLSYFKEKARRSNLDFEVVLVQPGGSRTDLSSDILKLLGNTELFLKKTTEGNLRVVVSR